MAMIPVTVAITLDDSSFQPKKYNFFVKKSFKIQYSGVPNHGRGHTTDGPKNQKHPQKGQFFCSAYVRARPRGLGGAVVFEGGP